MIKVVHDKKNVIAFFLLGVMLSTIFPITILPYAKSQTLSPFKQVEQGMHVLGVKCTGGMTLILKAETAMPFCVDASSVNTLVARGWAIMTSDFTTQSLSNSNRNFSKASYG